MEIVPHSQLIFDNQTGKHDCPRLLTHWLLPTLRVFALALLSTNVHRLLSSLISTATLLSTYVDERLRHVLRTTNACHQRNRQHLIVRISFTRTSESRLYSIQKTLKVRHIYITRANFADDLEANISALW